MSESASPQPKSLKDKAMGFFGKAKDVGSYVAKGAEEISVATGTTAAARESAALLTPMTNTIAEKTVAGVRSVDRGLSHGGNALKAGWDRAVGAYDFAKKYAALEPMGSRVLEKSKQAVNAVIETPADWVGEAGSWISTVYREKVAAAVDNIGLVINPDSLAEREEKKKKRAEAKDAKAQARAEAKAAKTSESAEVDPRVEAASGVIEGSELMKMVSQGREAAVKFDALPNASGLAMAEKILAGTDLLSEEGKAKTEEVATLKKKVMESRGEKPNQSWDREGRLSEKAEEKQREAIEVGIKVLDILPISAADLDRTTLNKARAKSIDLARKNRGVIRRLTSIAKSVEGRFPDMAEEVRSKLVEITTPLREKNEIAKTMYGQVETDDLMRPASRDLYMALIKSSDVFSGLTKSQQDEVTASLGATRKDGINGSNRYERYDSDEGSTYDVALKAYTEVAKASIAYDAMREHVDSNPEVACQLVVMAEKVTQAKQALRLASSKLKAELLITSKQVRDKEKNKTYDATHTVQEQASRKDRKDYYAKILKRQADRIKKEGPTVKKINKYIMIGGGAIAATIAGAEGASAVLQSAPEVIDLLKQAYDIATGIVGNVDLSGAAKAALGAGAIYGASKFSEWVGKRIGVGSEKQAEKVETKAAETVGASMEELTELANSLADDNPAKAQLQSIIGNLSKN